ncbi:DNA-binding protein [Streptomyces oceani]|uniref:DNA-binding protein n=2 Tax=Streptomyces oceani TaxID=1075402 RepID=A0A1E7KK06_9ACTN|nr:DNA-binding protein [Streptomyces oceani]
MAPDHVAYGMRASYGMPHITPGHIAAWERGVAQPTVNELTALAGALWCTPGELMGHPTTLLEHRLARAMAAEDVARVTGIPLETYLRMEETGQWTGDKRQSDELRTLFNLPPSDFVAIAGLEEELARLLTEAVSTRWQAHIRPIAKLVSMERRDLKDTLRTMHQEYQTFLAATLGWTGGNASASEESRRYLDNIVARFWGGLEGQ